MTTTATNPGLIPSPPSSLLRDSDGWVGLAKGSQGGGGGGDGASRGKGGRAGCGPGVSRVTWLGSEKGGERRGGEEEEGGAKPRGGMVIIT